MGEPEPYDPEQKPDAKAPRPTVRKAEWVVGAEEGLASEMQGGEPRLSEAPKLARPEDPDAGQPRPSGFFGTGVVPGRKAPRVIPSAPDPTPRMPAWDRGASSIPKLRTVEGDMGAAAKATPKAVEIQAAREFPMDDAEERARVAAVVAAQHREEAAIAARPHEVVKPQEFDLPAVAPPWWANLGAQLRDNRAMQAVIAVLLVAALAYVFWPRGEKTTSIAHLKDHPERYADTPVRVGGRVSEVFAVGGSWAYTVVQGRDTIVVFSRTREPRLRERIVVVGTLSRGYLDGQSRVAIFESTH